MLGTEGCIHGNLASGHHQALSHWNKFSGILTNHNLQKPKTYQGEGGLGKNGEAKLASDLDIILKIIKTV